MRRALGIIGIVLIVGLGAVTLLPTAGQDRTEERLADLETRVTALETTVAADPVATTAAREREDETPDGTAEDQTATGEGDEDAPLPVGEVGKVGDYEIRVVGVTPDATDLVLEENPLNEPPAAGNQFYLVRVAVRYTGSEPSDPAFDLNFQAVGEQNRDYDQSNALCGVIPNPNYEVGELVAGGTAGFDVCWQIASEDAESLVMYVDPLRTNEEDPRVWFALDEA